jgi:hypothetical protein
MANTEILARFDIDDSAIITKIANNKKEIGELKAANKDYISEYTKGLKDAQKEIKNQEASQKKLTDELKAGNITQSAYNQLIDDSNAQIKKAQFEVVELAKAYEVNSRAIAVNEEKVKALSTENRGLSTSYQAVIFAQNGLLQNYTSEGKSVQELREDNLKLIKIRNQLATATNGESEDIKKLNAIIDENTATIRANVSQDEKRILNIGNYREAFEGALASFKNGDFKGGLDQLREAGAGVGASLQGMVAQARAFIATPLGAAIAAIVAIGATTKFIFDFNEGLKESNLLLRSFGVSSQETSKVRSEIEATAKTFDKSFEEIAEKANSLSKAYGISMSEANTVIREGLATGGAQNEEFLDSLGEYDVFFQKAGFSAREFTNILNEGSTLGIYADKLPDAIKESGLALEEQTKTTRDALVNAFGASFTDDILKKVRTGEITTKDALSSIAAEAEKANLNQQQLAQLTADVFKGAGEDAGGALNVLKAISGAAKTELDAVAKSQLNLAKANEEYNKEQARLFEIEGFGTTWANIKTKALEFFTSALKYIGDFRDAIQPIINIVGVLLANAWAYLSGVVSTSFSVILGGFKILGNVISTFVNVVTALFSGDLKGALNALTQGFLNFGNIITTTFAKIKNTILGTLQDIVSNVAPILEVLGVDVDKLTKKLENFKTKIPESKDVNISGSVEETKVTKNVTKDSLSPEQIAASKKSLEDARKKIEEAKKAEQEALKEQLELAKNLVDEKIRLAGTELNNYILNNSSKLANEKVLSQALIEEEKTRLQTIADSRKKILDDELKAKQNNINQELEAEAIKSQSLSGTALENSNLYIETKRNELALLTSEYYGKDLQLKQETEAAKNSIDKLYSDQLAEQKQLTQALAYQEELITLEAKGATEFEIRSAQLDQQYEMEAQKYLDDIYNKFNLKIEADEENYTIQQELDLVKEELENQILVEKDANKLATLNNNLAQINQLEQKYAKNKEEITKASEAARLNSISSTLGTVQGLFKENTAAFKVIAIAQATIDTYKSAVSAYAAGLSIGGPAGLVAGPVAAGAAVAAGLLNVAKISGAKFQRGGVARGASHAQGGIPGIVAGQTPIEFEGGEAIINKKSTAKYAGLLSEINQDQGGVAFAAGGLIGSSLPSIQNQITQGLNTDVLAEVIGLAVERGSAIGTASGAASGIAERTTNINIENGASF